VALVRGEREVPSMTTRTFTVRAMTGDDAHAIAAWRYPGEYAFYDWDGDPDDEAELLDPSRWGRQYFAVDDGDGELVGFFDFTTQVDALEIGLGLRPDLTGHGYGLSFVQVGLDFAADRFGAGPVTLAVAAFNRRAITVYRRAGFEPVERYEHETNGGTHPFVRMSRPGPLAP
jgi:ribosomal-protein-alanine N-acetyltransferase